MSNQSVTKNVLQNSLGEIGSRFPLALGELIIAKVLGPVNYGLWATVQLTVNYNNFSHFGFLSSLAKLEPISIARGDIEESDKQRNSAFSAVLIIDVFLVVSFMMLGFFTNLFHNLFQYKLTIVGVALLMLMQQLYIYIEVCLQNRFAFMCWSKGRLLFSIVFLILICATVFSFGLPGLVFAWFLSYLVSVVYYFTSRPDIIPRFIMPYDKLKEMFWVGFPLYLFGLLKLLVFSLDKVFILYFFGASLLGPYNISASLVAITALLSGVISRVISPHLMNRVGNNHDYDQLYSFFKDVSRTGSFGVAVVAGFLAMIFPIFIHLFLNKYTEGIFPGVILIFGGCLAGQVMFVASLLMALDKHAALIKNSIIALFIFCIFFIFIRIVHGSIASVALASVLCWAIYNYLLLNDVIKISKGRLSTLKEFFSIYFPIVFVFLIFVPITYLQIEVYGNLSIAIFKQISINILCLTIMVIGFSLLGYKNEGVRLFNKGLEVLRNH